MDDKDGELYVGKESNHFLFYVQHGLGEVAAIYTMQPVLLRSHSVFIDEK